MHFPARPSHLRAAVFMLALLAVIVAAVPTLAAVGRVSEPDFTRLNVPSAPGDRSVVRDGDGRWLATFTRGSRTVIVRGRSRALREPGAPAVRSDVSVRLLDAPFRDRVPRRWLRRALRDRSPDVLDTALQYVAGASAVHDSRGHRVGGDASYGPEVAGAMREEGSDYNDYLGRVVIGADGRPDHPEARQHGALDCSGFVRMVFGFRHGFPLAGAAKTGLPRRAVQMAAADLGQHVDIARLQPGDLVFFDVSADDGADIDHVGIYVGRDAAGGRRFISSRKRADGPTFSDVGGPALLDGPGGYAQGLRLAKRL